MNNQNHALAMKIWPKTKKINLNSYERILIIDHEEKVPFDSEMYFMRFDRKKFSQSTMKKLVSWGLMKEKVRSLVKKCFCVLKWYEKFTFSSFEKFSHFTSFDEMKILRNSNKILSTLKNLKQTLTLCLSSYYPKPKCANEA